ncbi:MAG: helix-turn-helix domain-containing protein [Gemmataceae bacterium]
MPQRIEVLWLISQGLVYARAARLAGVSEATVDRYMAVYRQGGLDALREWKGHKAPRANSWSIASPWRNGFAAIHPTRWRKPASGSRRGIFHQRCQALFKFKLRQQQIELSLPNCLLDLDGRRGLGNSAEAHHLMIVLRRRCDVEHGNSFRSEMCEVVSAERVTVGRLEMSLPSRSAHPRTGKACIRALANGTEKDRSSSASAFGSSQRVSADGSRITGIRSCEYRPILIGGISSMAACRLRRPQCRLAHDPTRSSFLGCARARRHAVRDRFC